jgi:histidine ammonia-lyase
MSLEALKGSNAPFDARLQAARPHPGQAAVAKNLRALLAESEIMESHRDCGRVQDAYSLRCMPQVHGTFRDALAYVAGVVEREMNSATDNPLVFHEGGVAAEDALATGGGRVISGGNFHGEPVALALDFAKIAIAELGAISERRTSLLLDPRLNGGLAAFLAPASGLDSGLMIVQYTAAALASENKVLAHPASVDSIPTSANQEDHVSMGPIAARHARTVLGHVEQIVAIELLVGAEALDQRLELLAGDGASEPAAADVARPGAGVAIARDRIRAVVARLAGDREPGPDLAALTRLVHAGGLADLVTGAGPTPDGGSTVLHGNAR